MKARHYLKNVKDTTEDNLQNQTQLYLQMLSKLWRCVDISMLSGDRVFSNNGLILQPWSGSLPENKAVSHVFIELKRPLDQWLQSHANKRKSTHDNHKTQSLNGWRR